MSRVFELIRKVWAALGHASTAVWVFGGLVPGLTAFSLLNWAAELSAMQALAVGFLFGAGIVWWLGNRAMDKPMGESARMINSQTVHSNEAYGAIAPSQAEISHAIEKVQTVGFFANATDSTIHNIDVEMTEDMKTGVGIEGKGLFVSGISVRGPTGRKT